MRRSVLAALALVALALAEAPAQGLRPPPSPAPLPLIDPGSSPQLLLDALVAAWKARDTAGYLRLWRFASASEREDERVYAMLQLSGEEVDLRLERPFLAPDTTRFETPAQAISVTEPRARVEQVLFSAEKTETGWALVSRRPVGQIEGLLHLSLDPTPYKADGRRLRFEDMEVSFHSGTFFLSPPSLGPTLLVFSGEGTVRFRPPHAAEKTQLQRFCGSGELVETVRNVFLRVHPADLRGFLEPSDLEPDPPGARRLPDAQRFYRAQSEQAFVLDAALPRSPWWLTPALGDVFMVFDTRRRGLVSYALSGSEPEDVSLFDRAGRRHICLYPSQGRSTEYSEDDGRNADVLDHDLRVRFDPARSGIEGEDRLRIRLRSPTANVRLRLADELTVHWVRSDEAGRHLFFRVRHQDSIMVSLGPLAGTAGEITLAVRYGGRLEPRPVENDVLQVDPRYSGLPSPIVDSEAFLEPVLVYSNRTQWYPTAGSDDHATATVRFDVPEGHLAVTGGTLLSSDVEGERRRVAFRQDQPAKYLSVAVGRLQASGERPDGPVPLSVFAVPRLRGQAGRWLDLSERILAFYASEFGPCPYRRLNLALLEGSVPGGHSPPGMVVVVERPPLLQKPLADDPASFHHIPSFFLAHELAHQWWGHGVSGRNYRERWLSEAFAQYAAALWVRHHEGEQTFRSVLEHMAEWAFRMNDEGPIHLGQRLGAVQRDPQIYRAVVYDKGAYVLHMLRAIVGEETFRRGLEVFQQRHRFAKAGTTDLRLALEEASGRDLEPHFAEWVFGTSLPEITWRAEGSTAPDGTARTVVELRAVRLPGPVPVSVTASFPGRRTETKVVELGLQGARVEFRGPRPPDRITVNGDRGLLARVKKL